MRFFRFFRHNFELARQFIDRRAGTRSFPPFALSNLLLA
jgi:hypothetical protein